MAIDGLIQWIHANPHFGGILTCLISAAESIAILGTIVPGSIIMTAIGTLMGADILPWWPTLLWAMLGAILGDGVSYILGFTFKDRIKNMWPFSRYKNLLNSGEYFFKTHGAKSVFIGRFVGPVRAIVPLIAGMLGMRPWRFYSANILSAIPWAPMYMLPGYLLGAASLDLPPDIAIHIIFYLFIALSLIIFSVWVARMIYLRIGDWLHRHLTLIWLNMQKAPKRHFLTVLLRRAGGTHAYGQMGAGVLLIVLCIALIWVVLNAKFGGPLTHWNTILFHFFRSVRNPSLDGVMINITFLGEKWVILPVTFTLFIVFMWRRYTSAAWHCLGLGILVAASIEIVKYLVAAHRPGGVVTQLAGYAFPSGHAALAVALYGFLALLLAKEVQRASLRKFIYWITLILIALILFSRLYLSAHWFTDMLGGALLGAIALTITRISYFRYPQPSVSPLLILPVAILTLAVTWTTYDKKYFIEALYNAQRAWPIKEVTLTHWWNQSSDKIPLYRLDRGNHPIERLDVQWASRSSTLERVMRTLGWQTAPRFLWSDFLHPVNFAVRFSKLPLLPRLFNDIPPTITFVKKEQDHLLVLRLWNSHVLLQPNDLTLWVGTINYHTGHLKSEEATANAAMIELIDDLKQAKDLQWKITPFPDTVNTFRFSQDLLILK